MPEAGINISNRYIYMHMEKLLFNIIIPVLTGYIIFGFFLSFNQKSMIYYPDNQGFNNCVGFKDYEKINYNGTRFYFKKNSQSALVYYHGNTGSACDRSFLKSLFEKSNYSLIFVEYSGYAADSQKPSVDLILNDVRNIHDFLINKSFTNNIIYGQSIGSGAASYHASLGNVEKILLVTPFSSMKKLAQSKYIIYPASLLLTENYDNVKWLDNFDGEVMIIHGDNDNIIPNKFSRGLFESISSPKKEYVIIPGYGHNNIWNSQLIYEKIIEFINGVQN